MSKSSQDTAPGLDDYIRRDFYTPEELLWTEVLLQAIADLNRPWWHDLNSYTWFHHGWHKYVLDALRLDTARIEAHIKPRMDEITDYIERYEVMWSGFKFKKAGTKIVKFIPDEHRHTLPRHNIYETKPRRVVEVEDEALW